MILPRLDDEAHHIYVCDEPGEPSVISCMSHGIVIHPGRHLTEDGLNGGRGQMASWILLILSVA